MLQVAGNLHVTLWHQEGGPGPEGLVEGLAACVGQEVTLQLAALDLGPQAVAAQVRGWAWGERGLGHRWAWLGKRELGHKCVGRGGGGWE